MTDYNGWSNYETWAVNLWLENDEPSYRYWQKAAGEARAAHGLRRGKVALPRAVQSAKYALAERLKSEVGEAAPELEGLWADLLGAALQDVDWFEIAGHMLVE